MFHKLLKIEVQSKFVGYLKLYRFGLSVSLLQFAINNFDKSVGFVSVKKEIERRHDLQVLSQIFRTFSCFLRKTFL